MNPWFELTVVTTGNMWSKVSRIRMLSLRKNVTTIFIIIHDWKVERSAFGHICKKKKKKLSLPSKHYPYYIFYLNTFFMGLGEYFFLWPMWPAITAVTDFLSYSCLRCHYRPRLEKNSTRPGQIYICCPWLQTAHWYLCSFMAVWTGEQLERLSYSPLSLIYGLMSHLKFTHEHLYCTDTFSLMKNEMRK